MTIDELQVLITANTKQLQSEIAKTNKTVESLKKSADKTQAGVMSAFNKLKSGILALGIGKVISDSILNGMNAIESDSLFETSLGNMADSVRSWSDEIADTLGLNAVTMRKNTGVIYNMTTSMGVAEDNALKLSKGVSLLTEDMASFYNLSTDEAFNKLRAGLTGETEPLKALGILVDDNTIKQVAYQYGIAQTGAELTNQEKVLARYVAILKQTSNAQGDLARTIDSPSNQLRLFKNQVANLGLALSNFLIPVFKAVIPYVTAFTKVITMGLNALSKFLGLTGAASSTSTGFSDIADTTGDISNNVGNVSSGLGDVNKGLSTANKNAKKLKGNLAGFDEMNVLTDNSSSDTGTDTGSTGGGLGGTSSAIGGLGADGLFSLGEYDARLDSVSSKIDEIAEKMKNAFSSFAKGIDFTKISNSLGDLLDALKPFSQNIASGLKWLWTEILVPVSQWTINNVVPFFFDVLTASITLINNVLDDVKPLLSWLWDKFLKPVASWTGGVVADVLEALGGALKSIADNQVAVSILEGLALAIGGVTLALELYTGANLILNGIMAIGTGIASAFGTVMAFITSPITLVTVGIGLLIAGIILLIKNWDKVKEVALKVWDKVKEIWGVVADWFKDTVIEPVKKFFEPLVSWFKELFTSIKDSLKSIIEVAVGLIKGTVLIIKEVFKPIVKWFKDTIITPVGDFFKGMWDKLKDGAKKAWSGIKSVFEPVVTWFSEKFSKAWGKVKDIFSTGGKIFTGIKEGIADVFKTVVNGIIGGINKVIATPFNAINKLLNKVRDADVLGIKPFEDLIPYNALSIPQIPKLARGGVIDAPTLAMIGEAGKEAVVPLENNTAWIDKLADKIGGKTNGQPLQVIVQLGEETIFEKFIDYTKEKSFETNGEVFGL